jgi:Immunity protein 8
MLTTMESEVKSIMSTDIFCDLESYRPDDYESFMFPLTVSAGIKGKEGADMFDILVCSPKGLLDHYSPEEIILGRHMLIAFKLDMLFILGRIKKLFNGCIGENWDEIAVKLARIGHWEFEDYRE